MRLSASTKWISVLLILIGFTAGCQSLNDDPKNKRCWYPSLSEPGHLNPAHERNQPEGSDPFPSANIGPKSLQARPQYWDNPREWNRDVTYTPPIEASVAPASSDTASDSSSK